MNNIKITINEFIDSYNEEEKDYFLSEIKKLHSIISKYPEVRTYRYISDLTHQYYSKLNDYIKLDEINYKIHQKFHLLLLIKDSINRIESANYPNNIKEYFKKYYERTVKNIINDKIAKKSYNYKSGRFLKMQSVCTLFTFPIDPFILDSGKISLRFLFYNNIKQFFKGIYFIIFKFKGISPFYNTHTNLLDVDSMKSFTENGWRSMFLNLAELMKHQKDIKGVCGTSWFIDPIIKDISPRLSYINNLLTEIGVSIFPHNTTEQTIKDALFLNSERKKLYENGDYKPRNHLFVVTRSELIKWGETQKDNSTL